MRRRATEMKTVLDDVASKLFVQPKEDTKGLVKKETSLNDKPHMQSFSGVRHVSEATKILSGRGVFVYAYLSSIDTPKSTGVVKYISLAVRHIQR